MVTKKVTKKQATSKKKPKLSIKQKRFCDFYIQSGNATQAAVKAGYSKKTAKNIGNENLTKLYLKEYIQKRNDSLASERVADMQEVKEFWAEVLRADRYDEKIHTRDKLKASEFIAKTNGAFLERVEHSGTLDLVKIEIVKPTESNKNKKS